MKINEKCIALWISNEEYNKLKAECTKNDFTISYQIRKLIKDFNKKNKK